MRTRRVILIVLSLVIAVGLIAALKGNPFVDGSLCVGCGDCKAVCPVDAVTISDGKATIDQDKCIDCSICVKACQYRAIRTSQ